MREGLKIGRIPAYSFIRETATNAARIEGFAMHSQATKQCVIDAQAKARKRRADRLVALPLGVLIVLTYSHLIAGLIGG